MHHFLYPTQDSFISNKLTEISKNFGIDEMLVIGVSHSYSNVLNTTKIYSYNNELVSGMSFENFTGILTGSFFGISPNVRGTIVGGINRFTSSYFSGNLSGSVSGTETGSSIITTNFSGSLEGYSGNISSYIINGYVSSSLTANCFSVFTGQLTQSVGSGTGNVIGNEIKAEQHYTLVDRKYINRSLLKFDLSFISQSIVSGDIVNPKFYLKLTSTECRELPTSFKIHAFPVSQSWDQGDGYWSDDGSDIGVNWNYRDYYSGSSWFSPYTDTIITASVDYINNYALVSESFMRGGGTWYNIPSSQSFSYEVSDINMDVTTIVNSWLSGAAVNNGFILMYSGETNITSSNAHMFFFSKETNTIYSPKLDVAWDDSVWTTGSFGTGSVTVLSYTPRISGSMMSSSVISVLSATGSVVGSAYLALSPTYVVGSGSIVQLSGLTGTIKGIPINGLVLGTSSYTDVSGSNNIDVFLTDGDFVGCQIIAQYSSSVITGFLSGSFNGRLFSGHGIYDPQTEGSVLTQYSPAYGNLLGSISASSDINGGIFNGVVTSGVLQGAVVEIPFTGSLSYITSSFSVTSSVQITSSVLQQIDVNKPFVVIIQDLKKEYYFGDYPRIGVFGREHFPLKTFGKSPQQLSYVTPKVLPITSYYAVKDNETEEIVVDFDNYTKISCGLSGNYFYLDTTGLSQERYYKVLIRVVSDEKTYTFDAYDLFKVRR